MDLENVDKIYTKHFGKRYKVYRDLWDKAGKEVLLDFPLNLDFELVDGCNLRCRYCFRNSKIADAAQIKANTGKHLPMDIFKKSIDEGCMRGVPAVNLGFSGECLLSDNLINMIDTVSRTNIMDLRLVTNGTLMTEKMADELLKTRLTLLSFSIDAATPETYSLLKGRDFFRYVAGMIDYTYRRKKELKKDFPLIRATLYLAKENKGEKEMFQEKFKNCTDFLYFQKFYDMKSDIRRETSCWDPFRRLGVFADGSVTPCCTFSSKELIVGDIRKSTLKEIWDGEAARRVRQGLLEGEPVPVCARCLNPENTQKNKNKNEDVKCPKK